MKTLPRHYWPVERTYSVQMKKIRKVPQISKLFFLIQSRNGLLLFNLVRKIKVVKINSLHAINNCLIKGSNFQVHLSSRSHLRAQEIQRLGSRYLYRACLTLRVLLNLKYQHQIRSEELSQRTKRSRLATSRRKCKKPKKQVKKLSYLWMLKRNSWP